MYVNGATFVYFDEFCSSPNQQVATAFDIAEYYKLYIGIERIRWVEVEINRLSGRKQYNIITMPFFTDNVVTNYIYCLDLNNNIIYLIIILIIYFRQIVAAYVAG